MTYALISSLGKVLFTWFDGIISKILFLLLLFFSEVVAADFG